MDDPPATRRLPDPEAAEPAPIVTQLALRDLGGDVLVGETPHRDGNVFGGLVVGQALRAAESTVATVATMATAGTAGRAPHSLHASFLATGRPGLAIHYAVERTRDGGAFSTRRVVASQGERAILVLTASFQADEPGREYALPADLADIPPPEDCPIGRYDGEAFACRDVEPGCGPSWPPHARRMWFRARGTLPDEPALHRWALACATDHGPTRAVREPHAAESGIEQRHSVSLDHSVWFHRPVAVDGWLLSELWAMGTGGSRGLALGTIRQPDGTLVATLAQEALLRLPG